MAAAALEPAWCSADSPRPQSAARTSATETPRDTSPGTAPAVSVSKCRSLDVLSVDLQHNRQPDVGIGIRVQMHSTCYAPAQEYYGEYIGHGLTKTAFLLRRSTHRLDYVGAYLYGRCQMRLGHAENSSGTVPTT